MGAVLSLGLPAAIAGFYQRRKPISGYGWVNRLLDRTGRLFAPLARHTSLLGHELFKILAVGRGALILLGALALAALLSQSPPLGTSEPVEVNLESYYRQSQGPVGQETQAYLDKRKTRLAEEQAERDDLQRRYEAGEISEGEYAVQMMGYGELGAQAQALERYQAHVEALSQQPGSYVLPHWVYRELLSPNARTNSLYGVCICTVLCCLGPKPEWNGAPAWAGPAGRAVGRGYLRRRRQGAAWLLTILLSAGVWGCGCCSCGAAMGACRIWRLRPAVCLSGGPALGHQCFGALALPDAGADGVAGYLEQRDPLGHGKAGKGG